MKLCSPGTQSNLFCTRPQHKDYKLISGVCLYPEGGVRVSKGVCPNPYPFVFEILVLSCEKQHFVMTTDLLKSYSYQINGSAIINNPKSIVRIMIIYVTGLVLHNIWRFCWLLKRRQLKKVCGRVKFEKYFIRFDRPGTKWFCVLFIGKSIAKKEWMNQRIFSTSHNLSTKNQ